MAEKSFVTDDGVRLVYDDFGPSDGVPVVLCHGITMAGAQFRDTAAAFVDRGYRVLTPDLRGHARSGVPAEVSAHSFSLDRFADDQVALLDAAGIDRAHWVGNSLGGIVGLATLPRRRFLSLTTYGTAYGVALHGGFAGIWVTLAFRLLPSRWIARLMAMFVSADRGTRDYVASRILATRRDVIAAIARVLGRYDLRDRVRNAGIPVLLILCRRDWLVGWAMGPTLRLARHRPEVTITRLAGGHCADLDDPEAFRSAVLAFLASAGRV